MPSSSEAARRGLKEPEQFAGYLGEHGLAAIGSCSRTTASHIEMLIDATATIGKTDPAHISDVWLESAMTTIMDCEDSVAAVDAEDKVVAYRNWLGLMKGDLDEEVDQGRQDIRPASSIRTVEYTAPDGSS